MYASEGLAATTTYTVDRTDMLVARDDGTVTAFTYDAFGNMTRKATGGTATTDMAYDAADRLVGITPSSGPSATFTLDALGRPRTRLAGGATDTYAYLGTTQVAVEVSTSGSPAVRSLLDPDGSRLAVRRGTGTASFTLFDQLGSLVGLVGADRTVTAATRFDGWGETVDQAGTTQGPWGFRGHLDLSPTSDPLYAMGARLYAPSIGAFTQLDTYPGSAADPSSMNRFLYAEANPATLIDPTGHKAEGCGTDVTNAECTAISNANQVKARKKEQAQRARVAATGNRACAATGDCAGPSRVYVSPKPVVPVAPAAAGGCWVTHDCWSLPAVGSQPLQPGELGSQGGCGSFSFGLGAYFSVDTCPMVTRDGRQMGLVTSAQVGGMAGGGVSFGFGATRSNATDLSQLKDLGASAGASAVVGVGYGVEESWTSADGQLVEQTTGSFLVGLKGGPLAGEVHAGGGTTWVMTWDPAQFDWLRDFARQFYPEN